MLFVVSFVLQPIPGLLLRLFQAGSGSGPGVVVRPSALTVTGTVEWLLGALLSPIYGVALAVVFVAIARTEAERHGDSVARDSGPQLAAAMRLGPAEWRLTMALIILAVMMVGVTLGFAVLSVAVVSFIRGFMGWTGRPVGGLIQGFAIVTTELLALGLTRFVLAPAQAAATATVSLRQSWRWTRDWATFSIIVAAVAMAEAVRWGFVGTLAGAITALGSALDPRGRTLWISLTPTALLSNALFSLSTVLVAAMVIAPAWRVWRRKSDVSAVF